MEPRDAHQLTWSDVTARAIDAIERSGWLQGGIDQAVAQIAGPMLALNARPDPTLFGGSEADAAVWARQVERRFEGWARSSYACDVAAKQNLGQMCAHALRWWFATGEILGLVRYKKKPGNSHGTKIQVLPSQRVPQTSGSTVGTLRPARQGIIFDEDGAPQQYIFLNRDEGTNGTQEVLVEARDETGRMVVIHIHDAPPTVARGRTPLAPALRSVSYFEQLGKATLTQALLQAIFAATIKSDEPTEHVLQALQGEEEAEGSDFDRFMGARAQWYSKRGVDLGEHGKVLHLFPGEELDFLRSDSPNSNFKPTARFLLLEISRCLGITYEQLTGDREGATYSSERMGGAENWLITQYRRNIIAGRFMQVAYEAWLEEDIELGNTTFPGGIDAFINNRTLACRADWRGPPKPTADDLKTAKANQIKRVEGVITREMWCAEEGVDWQDVDDQRRRENDNEKRLKLDPPLPPTAGKPPVQPKPPAPSPNLDIEDRVEALEERIDGRDDYGRS